VDYKLWDHAIYLLFCLYLSVSSWIIITSKWDRFEKPNQNNVFPVITCPHLSPVRWFCLSRYSCFKELSRGHTKLYRDLSLIFYYNLLPLVVFHRQKYFALYVDPNSIVVVWYELYYFYAVVMIIPAGCRLLLRVLLSDFLMVSLSLILCRKSLWTNMEQIRRTQQLIYSTQQNSHAEFLLAFKL